MPFWLQDEDGVEYEFEDDIPEEEAVGWLQEALDVGRMVGQNAAASVAAGLTGVGSAIYNQDVGQAVQDMEAVQEKLGYQPETLEGQAIAAGLGAAGEAWEAPFKAAGEWVTDTTGSPLLGATVRTAPEALGFGVAGRIAKGTDLKAPKAYDPKTPLTRQKGIFEGVSSKTWDVDTAQLVKDQLDSGANPKKLFNETGYFKGIDGEMRKYSPHTSFIKKPGLVGKLYEDKLFLSGKGNRSFDIKSILPPDDPMVKGYGAFLNKTKVKINYDPEMQGSASGSISPRGGNKFEIEITSGDPHSAKVALVHEMQHLVQNVEKYKGTGTNAEMFKKGYPTAYDISEPAGFAKLMKDYDLTWDKDIPATENLNFWLKEIKGGKTAVPKQLIPVVEKFIQKEMKHLTKVYRDRHPMRRYETNAGEVEARIAEDWAVEPQGGVPSDRINIQKSRRNFSVLDPNRRITPEDIHYDAYDMGAALADRQDFGHIMDRIPQGYFKNK